MSPDRSNSIIAAYLAKKSVKAIAKEHFVKSACVYKILHNNGVKLRGRGQVKTGEQRANGTRLWDGFLIRPTKKQANQGRAAGLALIKIADLDPNFYK